MLTSCEFPYLLQIKPAFSGVAKLQVWRPVPNDYNYSYHQVVRVMGETHSQQAIDAHILT